MIRSNTIPEEQSEIKEKLKPIEDDLNNQLSNPIDKVDKKSDNDRLEKIER